MSFIAGAVRWIFGRIDWVVYGLIENVFQLIIDLANVEIFSDSVINDFARRLYIILGLVMVFKLMISFIQIIVNPDKMDDKEQGVGNVLKRVVISLALIVMVPSIFDLARQVQNYVVPIIPKVIMGANISPNTEDEDTAAMMSDVGRVMSFYSFLPFFGYDNPSCDDGSILGTGTSEVDGSNVSITSVASATTWDNLTKTDNCSTDSNNFIYTYRMGISTVVGVYLLWTLVNVGIYVAIRAIKLAICEFVAPIPIASYIDPKTSKQAFDNWVHVSVTTYLDLFVNLIGVYFVAFVFLTVFKTETLTTIYAKLGGSTSRGLFVTLFIIIGLIKFLKEAPKFITGMLGIKEGSGNLSAIFKGAGSMFATTVGAGVAGAGNLINGLRTPGRTAGQIARSTIAGAGSGLYHGFKSSLSGKSVKESLNASIQTPWTNRNQRAIDNANGIRGARGYLDRKIVQLQDWAQMQDPASLMSAQITASDNVASALSNFGNVVTGRMSKHENLSFRSGESDVLDSIARAIERNGGVAGLRNGNATEQRLARMFNVDANGNIVRNAAGHVEFAAGQGITYRQFEEIKTGLGDTALGGFFGSQGLEQDARREIKNDTAQHRAVDLQYDAHGNIIGQDLSGINEHREVVAARNKYYQAQRENVPNMAEVAGVGNTIEEHRAAVDADFDAYSNAITDYTNTVRQNVQGNADYTRREAIRRSNQARKNNKP